MYNISKPVTGLEVDYVCVSLSVRSVDVCSSVHTVRGVWADGSHAMAELSPAIGLTYSTVLQP